MNIPDSILDEAFAVYEEWGPNRRIERSKRLQEEFKELSSQEIESLMKCMSDVSKTVSSIAEMGGEAKLGRAKMTKLLQKKHPFLKSKGLVHALTLANYYAWHEGYDQ